MYLEDKNLGSKQSEPIEVPMWLHVSTELWRLELVKAAQRLMDHGWTQRRAVELDGRACMLGAIYYDSLDKNAEWPRVCRRELPNDVRMKAWNKLQAKLGVGVVWWNDRQCRSKEEAIAKLLEVAYQRG